MSYNVLSEAISREGIRLRYRIFKSPGAFNGAETCKAELVDTEYGKSVREVSAALMQAVKGSLKKIHGYENGSIAVSPPTEDGFSKETGTRFLSMKAIVEAKNEMPLIIHYDVIETVE